LLDFYALLFSRPFLKKYNRLILQLGMGGLGIRNRRIRGAAAILSSSTLEAVILEFNEMHVNAHTFLRDLIDRLQCFTPYRVLPGGRLLPLSPCSAWRTELFAYQNIAFVRTAVM
jgi:hypothetical protein